MTGRIGISHFYNGYHNLDGGAKRFSEAIKGLLKFHLFFSSLFDGILDMRSEHDEKTQHNQPFPESSGIDAYKRVQKRVIRGGNNREDSINDQED
jgi:hypothetical protein